MAKKATKDMNPDALSAVALQDHLVRSMNYNLSLSDPMKSIRKLNKQMAYKKPVVKAVVDTNRPSKMPKRDADAQQQPKEYVLDKKPPPPTLAQKLGLIEQPKALLNEKDWAEIKGKAAERHEFTQPCVICKEDIGKLCHVILSCTHVFHKNCLQAFERFSGKKSCPMCRKEQYQTRVVYDGTPAYQNKCASIIQAAWRGHVVRCWYRKLRQTVPPKDPKLRQKFYEDKLHTITERMVKSLDIGVNQLLYEVNRNLEASRLIFEQFETRQRQITPEQWINIHKKAKERDDNSECPICLTTLSENDLERLVVLTSCTHMFHETCLAMFEVLSEVNNKSCPVCRSLYQTQVIPCCLSEPFPSNSYIK